MTEKKDRKETPPEQVSEPQPGYGAGNADKTLRFFSSFEEMNEADAKEVAKFTPEQHLQHATELIQRIYSEELKKKFTDFKIYFK